MTVDRLSYCGGSDSGRKSSVLLDPWCDPETTCGDTSGTHGVADNLLGFKVRGRSDIDGDGIVESPAIVLLAPLFVPRCRRR